MTGNFVIDLMIICVGLPVLIGVGGDVAKRWIKLRERELELNAANGGSERSVEYREIIEKLEDRLRVLERIATDPSVNVAAQIEALRDEVDVEMEAMKEADRTKSARLKDEELN